MNMRVVLTIIFALCSAIGFSQVPGTLSYQGLLLDASNNPVPDGANVITFRFYTVETGGTFDATIGERTLSVQTFKGLFTAILGDGTAGNTALPSLVGSQQYWIGVTPVGGSELTPRVRLSTVPYAFRAQTVNAVDAATITTGTVPNAQLDADLQDLADGSLTGSKVDGTTLTTISATNITTGTLPSTVLDADLLDLADGSLTGSKVGTGISATNVTTGTLPNTVLDADLIDLSDGTLSGATLSLSGTDASKLATGTTAQRPGTPVEGQIRYNSTEKVMEYYNGTNWYFMVPKIAFVKDIKPNNTDGGNYTAATWQTRVLTTVEDLNAPSIASLNTNQFTLGPGEYIIEAAAPTYSLGQNRIKLFNVTGNTDAAYGSSNYSPSTGYTESLSNLFTRISIGTSTSFEIRQYAATTIASPIVLGVATNVGANEIYTQVKITKLR